MGIGNKGESRKGDTSPEIGLGREQYSGQVALVGSMTRTLQVIWLLVKGDVIHLFFV